MHVIFDNINLSTTYLENFHSFVPSQEYQASQLPWSRALPFCLWHSGPTISKAPGSLHATNTCLQSLAVTTRACGLEPSNTSCTYCLADYLSRGHDSAAIVNSNPTLHFLPSKESATLRSLFRSHKLQEGPCQWHSICWVFRTKEHILFENALFSKQP